MREIYLSYLSSIHQLHDARLSYIKDLYILRVVSKAGMGYADFCSPQSLETGNSGPVKSLPYPALPVDCNFTTQMRQRLDLTLVPRLMQVDLTCNLQRYYENYEILTCN
jgi:hypothetical protein